jgi:hypothetical protein
MAVEAASVDEAITTTADAAPENSELESSSGGVDVSVPEDGGSPDDVLGLSVPTSEEDAVQDEVQQPSEDPETPKEEVELGPRATKRVQDAVNRAKQAEVQLQNMRAEYQQHLQGVQYQFQQQMAQQQAMLAQQVEFYRKQAEASMTKRPEEDESKLTPAQRIEREWLNKAKQALMPEFDALKAQLGEERQQRERLMKAAQERKMLSEYKQRADHINRNILFKDFEPTDIDGMNSKAQELLLTWGTAAGEEPEQAVQGLKAFAEAYHKAKLKVISKRLGPKIKQSQVTPKTLPNTRAAATTGNKGVKYDWSSGKWV